MSKESRLKTKNNKISMTLKYFFVLYSQKPANKTITNKIYASNVGDMLLGWGSFV